MHKRGKVTLLGFLLAVLLVFVFVVGFGSGVEGVVTVKEYNLTTDTAIIKDATSGVELAKFRLDSPKVNLVMRGRRWRRIGVHEEVRCGPLAVRVSGASNEARICKDFHY